MVEREGEREGRGERLSVCVSPQSPKPAPYVKEMSDQALFYGNRVIKEYKGKEE